MAGGAMGCMVDGCQLPKRNRGLCAMHYARLHTRVKSGETTWAELEERGECLPSASAAGKKRFNSDPGSGRGRWE